MPVLTEPNPRVHASFVEAIREYREEGRYSRLEPAMLASQDQFGRYLDLLRADARPGVLRQRLTPPELLGRVGSTSLFIAAGGNCAGALLGGVIAARFGITAPFWAVVAVIVSASIWRVFNRAAVAQAYAEPG